MRLINWANEVQRAWGDRWNVPETAYKFTGGRTFNSTDRANSGVYGLPILDLLILDQDTTPLDMHRGHILMEDGGHLGQE